MGVVQVDASSVVLEYDAGDFTDPVLLVGIPESTGDTPGVVVRIQTFTDSQIQNPRSRKVEQPNLLHFYS